MNVDGKKVVLSGKFQRTKKEIKSLLEALGASVTAKVSSKTDMVFVGAQSTDRGTQAQLANDRDIPCLEESALEALLGGESTDTPEPATVETAPTSDTEEPEAAAQEESQELVGKRVAVTGKLAIMKRAEVHDLLTEIGAIVAKSVSKTTDLLIYGDGAGSKLDKAFQNEVDVISEIEFVELLEHDPRFLARVPDAHAAIAAEIARQDEAIPEVYNRVAPVWNRQRARWGATLHELLLAYIRVFSQREDIAVQYVKRRRRTGRWQLRSYAHVQHRVPSEMLALYYHFGGIQFHYVFEEHLATASKSSEGYNGGHINLLGLNDFRWYPMQKWQKNNPYIEPFTKSGYFDDLQPEGYVEIAYRQQQGERGQDSKLYFISSSDLERKPLGDIETYLTNGAKMGFVWYWPAAGYWEATNFCNRLYERSPDRSTPREQVEARLVEKGLDPTIATAMYEWLGEDTVILLHGD